MADVSLCFRTQSGRVSAASLQTALIALSADNLLDKYRGDKHLRPHTNILHVSELKV